MSTNELLKALNRAGVRSALGKSISTHLGLRVPSDTQLGRRNCFLAGRLLLVSGSASAAFSSAVLFAALSLSLAGCGVLQPGTTARTMQPPPTDTRGAQELALPTKQPEASSKPTQPVPQPAERISETKPPPAPASKRAEKLVTPNAPMLVRARERTTLAAEPPVPKVPTTEDSSSVTGAPVQALFFRGPPPEARPRRAGIKVLVCLGLVLGGVAVAVLARLYVIRRTKLVVLSEAPKDELEMPPELLFKEPTNPPQEAVAAQNP